VRVAAESSEQRRNYLASIQKEHLTIVSAIQSNAVTPARDAMRRHLLSSRKRYQKLAERLRDQ
jgi:DNA-binding FadR family transcriptional regulator